jgi:hypothetical protein
MRYHPSFMRLLALLAVAPVLAAASPPELDDGFEEDRPVPSIALLAPTAGTLDAALDVGWLRSGLRAGVGINSWVSLVAHLDSMILYNGLNAQNSVGAAVRVTPYRGPWRATLELGGTEIVVPVGAGSRTVAAFRAELAAGFVSERVGAYARVQLRGLASPTVGDDRWARDGELGAGVEVPLWSGLTLGAEAFSLSRGGLRPLFQWRLRVGYQR